MDPLLPPLSYATDLFGHIWNFILREFGKTFSEGWCTWRKWIQVYQTYYFTDGAEMQK